MLPVKINRHLVDLVFLGHVKAKEDYLADYNTMLATLVGFDMSLRIRTTLMSTVG